MDATIRRTSTGQLYQIVALTQQWKVRGEQVYRVAQVFTQGRLEMWLVPDHVMGDTRQG